MSDQGCNQHREGGEEAYEPDCGTPRPPAKGIGGDIGDAGGKVDPCGGLGHAAGLLAKGDDQHGDGEEDQPFEMVVHRALEAAGHGGHLPRGRPVAGRRGVARAKLAVRRDGEEGELGDLQEGGEGEGGEFGGHGLTAD